MLAFVASLGTSCQPPRRESRSGTYVVSLVEEEDGQGRWVRFEVRERDPDRRVFLSPRRWAARHRTEYAFDDADRVWLYSSDVGTSVWRHVAGDTWEELKHEEAARLPAPEPVASAWH